LASYGFVVCALEHRDGTSLRTFVNHPREPESAQTSQTDSTSSLNSKSKTREILHDTIDYVFPPENPNDTSPSNDKGVDYDLRSAQLRMRVAEIEEAYKVLVEICKGNGEAVAERNLRRKGYVGASSRGTNGVDWNSWKNAFYLDKVTMLGHSFGAATTVEVLRDPQRFDFVSQGIIMDIWGYVYLINSICKSH
jgi:platelet-activating factor acetylhydrolase